jgi:hypothetical protein
MGSAATAPQPLRSRGGSASRVEHMLLQVVAELVVGETEPGNVWNCNPAPFVCPVGWRVERDLDSKLTNRPAPLL